VFLTFYAWSTLLYFLLTGALGSTLSVMLRELAILFLAQIQADILVRELKVRLRKHW
jgi:hypothetical protein